MVGETVYLKFIIGLYWYTNYLKPLPICWLNSLMVWTNNYDAFVVGCGRNISDDACNRLLPFQNLILFYWKLSFSLLNNAFFCNFRLLWLVSTWKYRSSRSKIFFKTSALTNFAMFTGKKFVLESLFNKVAALKACIFTKKSLQLSCFRLNIAKF